MLDEPIMRPRRSHYILARFGVGAELTCMDSDADYYLHRAEVELAQARAAIHPAAAKAHYHLAGFYLDRVYAASTPDTNVTSLHAHQKSEAVDYRTSVHGHAGPLSGSRVGL